jgi:hypothetical protein
MIARRLLMGGGGAFAPPRGNGVLTYGTPFDITNDTKANALPSAGVLSNGDWLVIYTKSDDFETTKAVIVGKLSSDEGDTWGAEFSVVSHATLSTFNPGMCVLASGRVVIAYNLFNQAAGTTSADAVRVIYSDNPTAGASATWSSPYTVDASFTGYCANGTSRPAVLPNGTIVLPVYGDSGGNSSSQAFFSTDGGATFGGAVTMANGPADGRNYYEPSIAYLPATGVLLADYRTTGGAGDMYQNQSTDSGATWSATAVSHGGFSPSNIVQRELGTIVGVIRHNPDGDPHAFTSTDLGVTWNDQGQIQASFAMLYGLWLDRTDGTGLIIYSDQPGAAETNADIRGVVVTEGVA